MARRIRERDQTEVERYETLIAVRPMDDPNYIARRGAVTTNKVADNVAHITRTVKFSPRNVSVDLFRFNYLTGRDGFLEASFDEVGRKLGTPMPVNEAPGDMKGRWNKGENDVIYDFRPLAGRTYCYDVKVWGGFTAGNRDVHFHFEGKARCSQYVFTVDLSAYIAKGWTVNRVPEVYIDPANTAEHQIGEQRLPSNRVACTQADPAAGRWTWTITDFRGGIVDAVWDVTAPANSASKPTNG